MHLIFFQVSQVGCPVSYSMCTKKPQRICDCKRFNSAGNSRKKRHGTRRLHLCIHIYTYIYIYTYLYEAFKIRLSKSTSSVPPQTLEPYEIYYIIYPSRHFQTSRYINSIQFQQIGVCHSGQDTSPSPTCFAIHNDHTWHSSLARLVPAMEETNRTNT